MNQEFVNLLAERQEDVESLLSELNEFTYELRRKVQQLRGLIHVDKHNNVHQRLYRERWGLHCHTRTSTASGRLYKIWSINSPPAAPNPQSRNAAPNR